MIWLCIYLWLCTAAASLMAVMMVRPANRRDIVIAFAFPVLFPIFTIARVLKGN
ncbi:hypothetical protein [Shimia sp.]|uniref:hypothetical protein n=1 Tax=Shimia sp. TaxID=1954381 RepID=UPI003BA952D5